MSRFDLPPSLWFAFQSGRSFARAREWIYRARRDKVNELPREMVAKSVRYARESHHEYLRYVAHAKEHT